MSEIKYNIEYYPNGQLKYKFQTLNGLFHGIQKQWFDNGNNFMICLAINGQLNGIVEHGYSNNTKYRIVQWKNGQANGPKIEFIYLNKIQSQPPAGGPF